MSYSLMLAERVRHALRHERVITEKAMFGGLGFFYRGNMLAGIWRDSLILRLGPQAATLALAKPGVRPFDVTGRPLRGWVLVEPEVVDEDQALHAWIDRAMEWVVTLAPK